MTCVFMKCTSCTLMKKAAFASMVYDCLRVCNQQVGSVCKLAEQGVKCVREEEKIFRPSAMRSTLECFSSSYRIVVGCRPTCAVPVLPSDKLPGPPSQAAPRRAARPLLSKAPNLISATLYISFKYALQTYSILIVCAFSREDIPSSV